MFPAYGLDSKNFHIQKLIMVMGANCGLHITSNKSGLSRISFRGGGVQNFSGKVRVFAWRSARGFGGMLPRENF